MIKTLPISESVDEAIREVCQLESSVNMHQSYSKVVNYLIALGVDRYNQLFKRSVKPVKFDFGKYERRRYTSTPGRSALTVPGSEAPMKVGEAGGTSIAHLAGAVASSAPAQPIMRDIMPQDNEDLQERLQQLSNDELLDLTKQHREMRKANPKDRQTAQAYRLLVVECSRRGVTP